jgi:hypothetical protein
VRIEPSRCPELAVIQLHDLINLIEKDAIANNLIIGARTSMTSKKNQKPVQQGDWKRRNPNAVWTQVALTSGSRRTALEQKMNDMTSKNLVQVYNQPNTKRPAKNGLLWDLLLGPLEGSKNDTNICECGRYFCDKSDH